MASINPTARLTELDAVNSVLANIGQSPVNSLTDNSVDIGLATRHLGNSSRELQLRGWSFNTDDKYSLTPDSSTEKIAITSTMLSVEIDRVAYIRFASVYRDFKDVESFKVEVDSLLINEDSKIDYNAQLSFLDSLEIDFLQNTNRRKGLSKSIKNFQTKLV